MTDHVIRLAVNDKQIEATVPARLTLADFLRDRLGLTGTHLGCEHGVCGACTVLVDERSVRACITLAVQVDGCSITTVEGLTGPLADRLRAAFSRRHGLQCGFCTPGILITATEMIQNDSRPKPLTADYVRETLSGNTCRCTGYQGIVQAMLDAEVPDHITG
jgi:carbon-monoxide dehydrogenase small subunit